ncbi:hypothetical protein B7729_03145 [Streptococcus oralis subsp. tigurinus]|uniref:Uncharacterized protein n=2 Tax=Streptococcus oralis TaxID=1303 RepID=A0A1X1FZ71_STROR|nr:hypothetical protein B7729_03145 [Streptococcus oralis subsp. tigurinus]
MNRSKFSNSLEIILVIQREVRKMNTDQIIILLSGAGLGAVLSAILVFANNSKRNQLDYITKERSEWRKSIKLIIVDLLNGENRESAVNSLRTQINPYGYCRNIKYTNEYYMKDGHIWDLLNDFDYSEEKSQKLIQYLRLLLKYDWERSKNEVRINNNFLWNFLRWGLIILNLIMLFWAGNVNNEVNMYLSLFSVILLFLQPSLIKLLSKLNSDSPKEKTILILTFLVGFVSPYLYSLYLTIILLNFYNLIKVNLLVDILPVILVLVIISSEIFFLYQIFDIDHKYISQIKKIEKNRTDLELKYYEIYNLNYRLKQKLWDIKYNITKEDVNKLKKEQIKICKKLNKKLK